MVKRPNKKKKQSRAKPGVNGSGMNYRIVVRPRQEFKIFRYHDVGDKGHIQRLAGRRYDWSWDTQAWINGKLDAEIRNGKLLALTADVQNLLADWDQCPNTYVEIFLKRN